MHVFLVLPPLSCFILSEGSMVCSFPAISASVLVLFSFLLFLLT